MKVKNKLTRKSLEITYPEFRKKFVKDYKQLLIVTVKHS